MSVSGSHSLPYASEAAGQGPLTLPTGAGIDVRTIAENKASSKGWTMEQSSRPSAEVGSTSSSTSLLGVRGGPTQNGLKRAR